MWLRVFDEAALRMLAEDAFSTDVPGAEGSVSKMAHSRALGRRPQLPHEPLHSSLRVFVLWQLASPEQMA